MITVRKGNNYIWLTAVVFMLLGTSCSLTKKGSSKPNQASRELVGHEKLAFDETFFNGLSAKYAGDHKTAMANFQQCLILDPDNAAVKYELSDLYIQMGYNDMAAQMAEEVVAVNPDNRWYLENLASVYQNTKKFVESAAIYEQLIQAYPNEINYYYELGSAYLYANNAAGAIRTYENLEALAGFSNSLAEQLTKLYEHQKMDAKAEGKLKELVDHNPTEVRYVGMLAAFYKKRGEFDKSVALYEELKLNHPNDPYVKLALYEYYNELGNYDEAYRNLEQAFSSKEVNIDSKIGILLALMDLSVKNETIRAELFELMEIMTKTHPNDAKTWAIYGDYLYNQNQKEKSRRMFLKSISIDDSKYQVWNQVLFIDSELNEVDSIILHSSQCVELFPNQVLPHYFNGVGHLQKLEYKEAISSLEKAKELAYGMTELEIQIFANLGDAYYQVGDLQKSWLSYDQSLRMKPSNDYVLNNYAYFLSVEGEQLDKALEMSKKTVDNNPKNATYLDTYGWILYRMGKYEDAVKYLADAKKYSENPSGEILEHLGDALFKTNDVDGAVLNWKLALEKEGASENIGKKIETKKLVE